MSHNEYRDQLAYDNLTDNCDFCNGKAEFDFNDKDNCKTCLKDLAEQTELEFIKDEGKLTWQETCEICLNGGVYIDDNDETVVLDKEKTIKEMESIENKEIREFMIKVVNNTLD